jgi:hypothetical protein
MYPDKPSVILIEAIAPAPNTTAFAAPTAEMAFSNVHKTTSIASPSSVYDASPEAMILKSVFVRLRQRQKEAKKPYEVEKKVEERARKAR